MSTMSSAVSSRTFPISHLSHCPLLEARRRPLQQPREHVRVAPEPIALVVAQHRQKHANGLVAEPALPRLAFPGIAAHGFGPDGAAAAHGQAGAPRTLTQHSR